MGQEKFESAGERTGAGASKLSPGKVIGAAFRGRNTTTRKRLKYPLRT